MADVCPVCHSGETQAGLDRQMCLNCGAFFAPNDSGEQVQLTSGQQVGGTAGRGDQVPNGDGPAAEQVEVLEPETKGGRGLPVASQSSSTESALVQEGAVPQHGLLPGEGDNVERTAYDAPDGFTAPVMYNERLDTLAKPLAKATSRDEEVEASVKAEGVEPQVVLKRTELNADTLGSPVAEKAADPVDDDTRKTGADKDRTFTSAQELNDADTPSDTPDSLPANKTAEQKASGEIVPPPSADEAPAPPADTAPAAPAQADSDVPVEG